MADKQKAKIQVQDDHKDAKVNAALKTTVKGVKYATNSDEADRIWIGGTCSMLFMASAL